MAIIAIFTTLNMPGVLTRGNSPIMTALATANDGKMIDLDMMPQYVSQPTWKNFGSKYVDKSGGIQVLQMEQVIIHVFKQ